jgi:hypothetical protein
MLLFQGNRRTGYQISEVSHEDALAIAKQFHMILCHIDKQGKRYYILTNARGRECGRVCFWRKQIIQMSIY